jgi:hypothetical protein
MTKNDFKNHAPLSEEGSQSFLRSFHQYGNSWVFLSFSAKERWLAHTFSTALLPFLKARWVSYQYWAMTPPFCPCDEDRFTLLYDKQWSIKIMHHYLTLQLYILLCPCKAIIRIKIVNFFQLLPSPRSLYQFSSVIHWWQKVSDVENF